MRSFIHTLFALFIVQFCWTQTLKDVVGHTLPQLNGSARFTAMAGSFGALGGDLTAISHYPAAGAVFLHSEVGVGVDFVENATKTNYFGGDLEQENSNFNFNQIGFNFVFNNQDEESEWNRISIGFNINKVSNFNNNYNAQGFNDQNGLDSYFLSYADGISQGEIELIDNETVSEAYGEIGSFYGFGGQQAFLGFQSYIINPDLNSLADDRYVSNALYDRLYHDYQVNESGFHRKYTLNIGGLYNDILFLGANFNYHRMETLRIESINEFDYALNSNLVESYFENELFSYGDGFSFQFGAILKVKNARLGLTYDSPQWLTINEEIEQYIETIHSVSDSSQKDIISPDFVNIYEPYSLKLPAKLTTSFAYIFGKSGLISIDYSTQNFENIRYSDQGNSSYLVTLNEDIGSSFKNIQQLRIGAEYRIKTISLRAGYFSIGSAFKNINEPNTGFTTGIGFDFGNKTLNLGLVFQEQNSQYQLLNRGLTNQYNLFENLTQFVISYNIKL